MTVKFYRYTSIRDYQFNFPFLNNDAFYVEDPDGADGQGKEYRVTRGGREAEGTDGGTGAKDPLGRR